MRRFLASSILVAALALAGSAVWAQAAADPLTTLAQLGSQTVVQTSAEVIDMDKLTHFAVLGEVHKPGVFPISLDMTLSRAIEQAEGLTGAADAHRITIQRTVGGKSQVTSYDLQSILSSGKGNPKIAAGDTVYVPCDARDTFTILGAVNKPGIYPAAPRMTLSAAIEKAGGPTRNAAMDRVMIKRAGDAGGRGTVYDLTGLQVTDPYLQAGDVVVVAADPWAKPVTVEFQVTPLSTAVQTLLKDSGMNYALNHELGNARVSAKLKDIPLRQALAQVTAAAGAVAQFYDGNVTISSPQVLASAATAPAMGPQTDSVDKAGPRVTVVIELRYLSAADVIPLLPAASGVRVVQSTGNALVVTGDEESVEELKQLVAALDKPEALPRSVNITLKAQVRVARSSADAKAKLELTEAEITLESAVEAEKQAKVRSEAGLAPMEEYRKAESALQLAAARYDFAKQQANASPAESTVSTQSIGLEGSQVRLDISAGKPESGDVQLRAELVPVILTEDGAEGKPPVQTISLTGRGTLSGCAPFPFSKQFDVAVSIKPGEEAVIASGSADVADGSLTFEVRVRAEIEQGRIKLPPGSQQKPSSGLGGGYRSW